MARARKENVIPFKASEGYRWIEKDPIIDEMLYLAKKDGRSLSSIAHAAFMSPTTILNWDKGKTRRPNHISISSFTRAMGYEMKFVKSEQPLVINRWRKPKA